MTAWWAYRVRRRWAGPLAGSALLLTASCVLGVAPDLPAPTARTGPAGPRAVNPPAITSLRVLQLNLCNSGDAGCYTGRSVAEAAVVIRTEVPDVVTLNEVCADDVPVLEKALADAAGSAGGGAGAEVVGGGTTVSAFRAVGDRRTQAPVRCHTGRPYGIGLIVRRPTGGPDGTVYATIGGVYPVQPTRGPEQRAWLCLSPTGGRTATGPAAVVCTTHLSNGNPTVAGAQCAYLLGTAVPAVRAQQVRTLGGSAPVVLGGDLNLSTGGTPDVRACVPPGDRRVDDGAVQHVVATSEFTVGSRRTIGLTATDHPGLLVTLTSTGRPAVGPVRPVAAGAVSR